MPFDSFLLKNLMKKNNLHSWEGPAAEKRQTSCGRKTDAVHKKEPPRAGTRGGSVQGLAPKNDCAIIISTFAQKHKPQFCRAGCGIMCPRRASCPSPSWPGCRWQRMIKKQDWCSQNCDGRYNKAACCKGCQRFYTCKFVCSRFAEEIAKHKAKDKEQKKTERKEEKANVAASWARFHAARGAAKMKIKYVLGLSIREMRSGRLRECPGKRISGRNWSAGRISLPVVAVSPLIRARIGWNTGIATAATSALPSTLQMDATSP